MAFNKLLNPENIFLMKKKKKIGKSYYGKGLALLINMNKSDVILRGNLLLKALVKTC